MVNWKGFRRKGSSLMQYAEICLEKPERRKETNTTVNDSTEIRTRYALSSTAHRHHQPIRQVPVVDTTLLT